MLLQQFCLLPMTREYSEPTVASVFAHALKVSKRGPILVRLYWLGYTYYSLPYTERHTEMQCDHTC